MPTRIVHNEFSITVTSLFIQITEFLIDYFLTNTFYGMNNNTKVQRLWQESGQEENP